MTGSRALVVVVLLAGSLAACTKTESSSSSGAPSASTSATPTPATASAAPSAAESASAGSSATADTATPSATASGATTAAAKKDAAAPAATGSAAAAAECGTKPQPDCPLQAWMKANANPPMLAADLPGLATALDKIVALAPPGYTNWASIAKDGAKAARAGDMTATKASCRTCHDQYKDKYKKEMRARKI